MNLINIAIAQDNETYIESLTFILKSFTGIKISLVAKNGKELLETLQPQNKPDVILMDINMPIMDGFVTTTEVLKIVPECKIIFLTSYDKESFIQQAIKSQAHGYLLKSTDANYLHDAICEVIENGYYFNEFFTYSKLIETFPNNENIQQLKPMKTKLKFTDQERQFMRLLFEEKTDEEIAKIMNLKVPKIEKISNDLLTKVDVKSNLGIVSFAIKHHFI